MRTERTDEKEREKERNLKELFRVYSLPTITDMFILNILVEDVSSNV